MLFCLEPTSPSRWKKQKNSSFQFRRCPADQLIAEIRATDSNGPTHRTDHKTVSTTLTFGNLEAGGSLLKWGRGAQVFFSETKDVLLFSAQVYVVRFPKRRHIFWRTVPNYWFLYIFQTFLPKSLFSRISPLQTWMKLRSYNAKICRRSRGAVRTQTHDLGNTRRTEFHIMKLHDKY